MAKDIPLTFDSVVVRSHDQVTAVIEEESVVLSTRTWNYYAFNRVGNYIWHTIETPQSLSQIRDSLLNQFEIEVATCEQDVLSFVESLMHNELAEIVS